MARVARETGRLSATGAVLVYVDADCRAPLTWLARIGGFDTSIEFHGEDIALTLFRSGSWAA